MIEKSSPKRTYTLISKEVPNLDIPTNTYGLETVLNGESYYSQLRLEKNTRPNTVLALAPWRIEPKPWKEVSKDLYYRNEGYFLEGENYFTSGSLELQDSILELKKKIEKKLTEDDVIDKIEKLVCKKDSPWDWSNEAHKATLLKEHIPRHLKRKRTNIIKQVTSAYFGFLALNLKEPENGERFCIVINGRSGTQKTKLSKLIMEKLAESKIVTSPTSYAMWEEQDLTDKLERIDNKEVVIFDDYSGDNHKIGVLNKLISDSSVSKIRVMGDYQTTRYIKGVIVPTVDAVETWITNKTGTIRKFEQIYRRADCNLYIFKKKHVKSPTWEDYRDRLFYVGNIRRWIYETLEQSVKDILDEPLFAYNKDTALAHQLNRLFHVVVNSLYKDKKYWNGEFTRDKVPHRFWSHQPETKKWAEPGIIQMFKLPDYEWLRKNILKLKNPDLNLPLKDVVTSEIRKENNTRPLRKQSW